MSEGLYISREKIMLNSYKTKSGTAIRHCVTTSGGVKNAAMINTRSMAYLLLEDKKVGVIIPIFVRNSTAKGSSKMTPNARHNALINEMYLSMLIIGLKKGVANPIRNPSPIGTIM